VALPLTASLVLSLAPAYAPGGGARAASPERVVFFDNFSGPTLDRSHWNVEVTGQDIPSFNQEAQAYVDAPETIYIIRHAPGAHRGALALHPRYRPGHRAPDGHAYDFVSGRITTAAKVTLAYGTAAARIRLPDAPGIWPAFWALGQDIGEVGWPACGETDAMEYVGDRTWTSSAVHGPGYSGATPLTRRHTLTPGTATRWHVYAATWTPDTIVFTINRRIVYTVTRAGVDQYGPWAFDRAKFLLLNTAVGGVYPAAVNGVTEPYLGVPQATLDRIKADSKADGRADGRADGKRRGGRMLVDWVKVSAPRS